MNRYRVHFIGCRKDAPTLPHPCQLDFDAESPNDAYLRTWATHHGVHSPRVVRLERAPDGTWQEP